MVLGMDIPPGHFTSLGDKSKKQGIQQPTPIPCYEGQKREVFGGVLSII